MSLEDLTLVEDQYICCQRVGSTDTIEVDIGAIHTHDEFGSQSLLSAYKRVRRAYPGPAVGGIKRLRDLVGNRGFLNGTMCRSH